MKLDDVPVTVLLHLPDRADAPVFVGYNFCGNQATVASGELAINPGWANDEVCRDKVDPSAATLADGRFLPGSRGIRAYRWPMADIVNRGFGVATAYYGDVLPDNPQAYKLFMAKRPQLDAGAHSAIDIWSAGLSAIIDVLLQQGLVTEGHWTSREVG